MLLEENLIAYIKYYLLVQRLQGTCPYKVSKSLNLNSNSPGKMRWEHIKTTLYALYVCVLWIQLIHERRSVELVISLESLLFATGAQVFCFTKWVTFKRRDQLIELFNLFLQFEKQHLYSKFRINFLKYIDVGT